MTNNEPNQQQYPQNYPPYDDEINLIDYLKVLWKWKWLIIAGTLICAIAAAIISLQMPKIYEISTVIEPGIAGLKSDNGGFIHIDSVVNISGKINEGIYNRRVEKALHLDSLKTSVGFKSAIVKKANVIKITSQWQEGDTDFGVKVTGQLIRFLSDDYRKIVERREGDYDRQIIMKQSEISKIETQRKDIDKQIELKLNSIKRAQNDIKVRQATLENARERRGGLLDEIKSVKDNTEKIMQQRDFLLKNKNPDKDLSLLLYSTTIQQNVVYFNQLTNQIYDMGTAEKKIESEIDRLNKNIDDIKTGIERLKLSKTERLQISIHDIKTEINALNLEKGLISNIKVMQEPEVSLHPVKPKKKQIVLLTTVVALFMAVFLAFFIEYIKNASKASSANKRT
jgi:LPS O-antigen subunit length determinant protein (WzzB/FepE family)